MDSTLVAVKGSWTEQREKLSCDTASARASAPSAPPGTAKLGGPFRVGLHGSEGVWLYILPGGGQ